MSEYSRNNNDIKLQIEHDNHIAILSDDQDWVIDYVIDIKDKEIQQLKQQLESCQSQLKYAVEVIEMISVYDRVPTPCPDNKEGCLVAHFKKGNGAIIADHFLSKYRGENE